MKKLILIMGLCCGMNMANAQAPSENPSFQDNQHNVIGYIRNATIFDVNNNFLGQFKLENQGYTLLNKDRQVVGYIARGEKEIQDKNHNPVGYLVIDRNTYNMRVEDALHNKIGEIKATGAVENAAHTVLGYISHTEPMWAAAYYLLPKF
jgi:hypothetical protein